MSQLCFYLPPFASDYSGVCSSLFDIDAMVVLHDGACCTRNYTNFDEPRWFGNKRPTFCSGLREVDAVLGADEKLVSKVKNTLRDQPAPAFLALLGSPVPALVGADMEGIARELEEDTGIPALGFSTTGFDYYDKGISDTAIKLIKRFSKKRETYKNSRTINVLGLTPLDFGADGNAEAIVRTLNEWGFTVNADLFFHTSMEELEHISNAGISVAVSAAGVKPAKYLAAEYGIPWTSGIPARWNLPLKERLEWLDDDRTNNAAVKATAVRTAIAPEGHGNILVVADQIAANAVREHLEYLIDADITCATFFTLHKELARPCDFRIGSENELVGIIESGKYRAVCGDPVLKEIPGVKELTFLDIPHPAVSSRLNWNDMPVIGSHELEETYYEFVRKLL